MLPVELLRIASAVSTCLGLLGLIASLLWHLIHVHNSRSVRQELLGGGLEPSQLSAVRAIKDPVRQVEALRHFAKMHHRDAESFERLLPKLGTQLQLMHQRRNNRMALAGAGITFLLLGLIGFLLSLQSPQEPVRPDQWQEERFDAARRGNNGYPSLDDSTDRGTDTKTGEQNSGAAKPDHPTEDGTVVEKLCDGRIALTAVNEGNVIRVGDKLWFAEFEEHPHNKIAERKEHANRELGAKDPKWRIPTFNELRELLCASPTAHKTGDLIWLDGSNRLWAPVLQYGENGTAVRRDVLKSTPAFVRLVRNARPEK